MICPQCGGDMSRMLPLEGYPDEEGLPRAALFDVEEVINYGIMPGKDQQIMRDACPLAVCQPCGRGVWLTDDENIRGWSTVVMVMAGVNVMVEEL